MTISLAPGLKPQEHNPQFIDQWPTVSWSQELHPSPRLLVCTQASPVAEIIQQYASYLCDLLDGEISSFDREANTRACFDRLINKTKYGHDLVIFGEPHQSLLNKLVAGSAGRKAVEQIPTSVLLARNPRWPIKQILLITRGQSIDEVAVDWALKVAQPGNARIFLWGEATINGPATYTPHSSTDTTLSRQIDRITRSLPYHPPQEVLRHPIDGANRPIKREVTGQAYDLVVVAADPADWWQRRLLGELVNPILEWLDRPILIAKTTAV